MHITYLKGSFLLYMYACHYIGFLFLLFFPFFVHAEHPPPLTTTHLTTSSGLNEHDCNITVKRKEKQMPSIQQCLLYATIYY